MSEACLKSNKLIVRTLKENSVFVYFLMESLEGVTAYSTLPHKEGDNHRDLLLQFPENFSDEVNDFLDELGDIVLFSEHCSK